MGGLREVRMPTGGQHVSQFIADALILPIQPYDVQAEPQPHMSLFPSAPRLTGVSARQVLGLTA